MSGVRRLSGVRSQEVEWCQESGVRRLSGVRSQEVEWCQESGG